LQIINNVLKKYILPVIIILSSCFNNRTAITYSKTDIVYQQLSDYDDLILDNNENLALILSDYIEPEQDEDDELFNFKFSIISTDLNLFFYRYRYSLRFYFKKKLTNLLLNLDIPPPYSYII